MVGYSNYLITLISSFILLTSVSTSNGSKLTFKKTIIKADRSSPAFAAIEDLYSLEDLTQKSITRSKTIKKIELKELKSVKLDGAKISLNESIKFDNIDKSNFVKIALHGERIGVRHFTKKFIKPDLQVAKLSDFKNNWGKSIEVAQNLEVDSKHQELRDMNKLIDTDIFSQKRKVRDSINEEQNLSAVALAAKKAVQRSLAASAALNPANPESNRAPKFKNRASGRSVFNKSSFVTRKMLNGQLVLKDGDFTPGEDFIFYVERLFDGVVYESGVVNSESGVFKMEVESARGLIYSELRNAQGEVLAYGELNLSKEKDLNNITLELYPSAEDFSGRSLSQDSFEDIEVPVVNASQTLSGVEGELGSDSEGYFNEKVFSKGSSFIAATHAQDFWSSLSIGVNGKPLYPKLYSKKHIKALSELADPFGEEIEITSLITGRITHSGLSQEGVSVRLYSAEYHKPLYFNATIPDPKALKTSEDGRFAFINLIDGDYLVQAFKNDKLLSQRWFKVRRNHVSSGQIEIGKSYELELITSVFPPNSEANEKLEISEIGVDLFKELDHGDTVDPLPLKLTSNPELTALQSLETNFHKNQISVVSAKSKLHHLTKVDKNWINTFLASKRSNANHAMAMIFGRFKEDAKKVILKASSAKTMDTKVYYFDESGLSTDLPVSGGGFLITEVPEGLNTIVFSNSNDSEFASKLVLSQKRSLSVLAN